MTILSQTAVPCMEKLILTAAITGAELTKDKVPALPISPEEQATASVDAVRAGAAVIHMHVRDDQGRPSQELKHFERSVNAIRSAIKSAGLEQPILQFSTGGAVGEPIERRAAPLSLKPEMASFNLGTMNFGDDVFENRRPDMRSLAEAFLKYGVVPEFEIYDLGHIDELHRLIGEGLAKPPYHVQLVLGVVGGALPYVDPKAPSAERLQFLVSQLPKPHSWAVAGIGRYERPLAELAIPLGGHVRVGLEDNVYLRKGVLATSNAELVKDIRVVADGKKRAVASISEARGILGIP